MTLELKGIFLVLLLYYIGPQLSLALYGRLRSNSMLDYEVFKPIRNLGLLLIVVGIAGIVCHLAFMKDSDYIIVAQVFVVSVSIFHLFIGYNIVSRNRWGFKCLRVYLYLIYPGFPLGYYYAKRMFEYIEINEIESFFGRSLKI